MLPTPRPVVAICWTCGQPGAHGTADECIAALKRAAANLVPVTPRVVLNPPAVYPIVVRYVGKHNCRIVLSTTSLAQALRWIHGVKRQRGKAARHYYWMERLNAPASTRR